MTRIVRIGIVAGIVLLAGVAGTAYKYRRKLHIFGAADGANSFETGQCTWYAFARAKEAGWVIHFDQSYGRHARDWPQRVINAKLISTPATGEIMVLEGWKGNPYGHVAVVEAVTDKDHWTVTHSNMLAGSDYGVLAGQTIRLAKVERRGRNVFFEGKAMPLALIGFLTRS